ncbi:MAG TPA: DUF1579 family protein [Cytophagales bacterium]|nr:DUF1579 family protein [Cytophagales bacterium]
MTVVDIHQKHNNKNGYKLLDAFVGKWNTIGHFQTDASEPLVTITGTDTYEWLPGGFFLLHRVDVQMGNEKNETLEIIGYDEKSNTYPMHYFDNKGNTGSMQANFDNGTWTFLGESMRFTGGFREEGKILSGIWEQSFNGTEWVPLMDIKLTKAN